MVLAVVVVVVFDMVLTALMGAAAEAVGLMMLESVSDDVDGDDEGADGADGADAADDDDDDDDDADDADDGDGGAASSNASRTRATACARVLQGVFLLGFLCVFVSASVYLFVSLCLCVMFVHSV